MLIRVRVLTAVFLIFHCFSCAQITLRPESHYQKKWCSEHKGEIEKRMPDKTRCDCLTSKYAVEVKSAENWMHAIGQSLNYAKQSGKRPGIVLFCRKKSERHKYLHARQFLKFYEFKIKLWEIDCE